MQGGLLDDPALIDGADDDAGLDPKRLAAWCATAEAAAALDADAAAARAPSPAARALDHKLGGPREQRRYTAPSYVIDGVAIPGYNPVEAYEAAIANRAAQLPRRLKPESTHGLLEWAGEPLATAEVALVMQVDLDKAREALSTVARWEPAGADGYWTL